MCTMYHPPADTETGLTDAAGAADDQHVFDLNVRLQYSDDPVVLTQALQVDQSGQQTSAVLVALRCAACLHAFCVQLCSSFSHCVSYQASDDLPGCRS